MLFAEKWNTTPFDVLKQDIDDFILVANGLIEIGSKETKNSAVKPQKTKHNPNERIRVNDKTATGGWW